MNFIRLSTWKNKLAPFLCIMYAFYYKNPFTVFEKQLQIIFFLLVGIILLAIWASLINNYFDLEVDTKVGKPNGMAGITPFFRVVSLLLCMLTGLVYTYFLLSYKLSILFYGLSWLCFYVYSATSIRLKEKPFLDLLADGLASQLFPSLFIFVFLFKEDFQNNYLFIFSGSLWLFFAMGVRALIIHQYGDKEKDQKAGLTTYVVGINEVIRKNTELFLLFLEIIAFTVFALSIHWISFILPLVCYIVLFYVLIHSYQNIRIVYFKVTNEEAHRIFLYDAYTLFVFCLLGLLCWQNYQNLVLLVVHLLVFHSAILVKMYNKISV
ncbi:UbiA family prenyltransferase [Arundinibacter roseus]|uniref:Prenyltransferase n=1 Tax=Arundinibacter roseus TaxID=2070510 RepID=A0A4R4KH43_9BACT|nr:UbiA family prenyltransferase [Arundinibacter roseus]TDB67390.1 hypothetical protein EZE20_05425 [Arundinibacter roseus]